MRMAVIGTGNVGATLGRRWVARLAWELGFEPVDLGPPKAARYLEPMAMAGISLAYQAGMGPDFGFAVLRRD